MYRDVQMKIRDVHRNTEDTRTMLDGLNLQAREKVIRLFCCAGDMQLLGLTVGLSQTRSDSVRVASGGRGSICYQDGGSALVRSFVYLR